MHDFGWAWGALALIVGGILKGATGAGAPIVAVPILAIIVDVPFAIATLVLPSLFTNIWQAWRFRGAMTSPAFLAAFAIAAAFGATAGSILLVMLPSEFLLMAVSSVVFLYIGFRIVHPGWILSRRVANLMVAPIGFAGGVLQGAAGVSAPISITFLNAMRLSREEFIVTISTFFLTMSAVQVPVLAGLGVLTFDRALISLLACLPLFGAMPIGAALARHISRETFDKIMLAVLAVMATRLIAEAIFF